MLREYAGCEIEDQSSLILGHRSIARSYSPFCNHAIPISTPGMDSVSR
jgi:hypothetical protein